MRDKEEREEKEGEIGCDSRPEEKIYGRNHEEGNDPKLKPAPSSTLNRRRRPGHEKREEYEAAEDISRPGTTPRIVGGCGKISRERGNGGGDRRRDHAGDGDYKKERENASHTTERSVEFEPAKKVDRGHVAEHLRHRCRHDARNQMRGRSSERCDK